MSGGGRWGQYNKMTGSEEPLTMATHFGADRALKKPIRIQQLLALIEELLQK